MPRPSLHSLLERVRSAEKEPNWRDVPEDIRAMIDASIVAYAGHRSFSRRRMMCAAYAAGLSAKLSMEEDNAEA